MKNLPIKIDKFDNKRDRKQVISLWKEVFGYESPHNDPGLVIDKKLQVSDGLFFVAMREEKAVGTVMAGYDGHRGWIYSLAVLPAYQKSGIATSLLKHAEKSLLKLGCVKINLQILEENKGVVAFYLANGYKAEKRISMGKKLIENVDYSSDKDIL